jgi:hypothetical protein
VREECIVSNGMAGMFSFVPLCRPYIPCNSSTEDTSDIIGSFFSVTLVCHMCI